MMKLTFFDVCFHSISTAFFFLFISEVLHAAVTTEWHLGMKICSNGSFGVREFYNDPCTCNKTSTLEDLKASGTQHYTSCLINSMNNVIQVRTTDTVM
jgi:hypothetical protein